MMLDATMMNSQLSVWRLFENAEQHHGHTEIVSRSPQGQIHRYSFSTFALRTRQLMNSLDALGIGDGAVVATLAWNSYRHLEAYFAVPCAGRVLHTLNVRLSAEELAFIINDAQDELILVDPDFASLLAEVLPLTPSVRRVIVLAEDTSCFDDVHLSWPETVAYETLLATQPAVYQPCELDEWTPAGLCYTSGTTGRPKGVVSTHRSVFLHALAVSSGAGVSVGPSDCVLPQVPMFHAWAWGLPFACVGVGAKIVLFAGPLEAEAFVDLLVDEEVTVTAGVPTVWIALANELEKPARALKDVRHILCGGSQPPRSLIERYENEFGLSIVQAWGMTETSPLASVAWPQHRMRHWDRDRIRDAACRQAGLPVPGVTVRIVEDSGELAAFDGDSMGALQVRGPWVTAGYLHGSGKEQFTDDGWFDTGDVAIGSPDGYFVIADRTKDLIKSGGEWISSVDMEAAIMAMPNVLEAAVIAIPDEKWGERPLAFVVSNGESAVQIDDVHSHLLERGFARWQLPDRVEQITEVPKTAVGKFDKKVLRRQANR